MKKSVKKISGVLLVTALTTSTFAGCSSTSKSANAGGNSKEKVSFKVTTVSFGEDPTGKKVEDAWLKKTGELMGKELNPTFEYIHMQDYADKFKIMLASNNLPDIITNWGLTQDEVIKYGDSGLFVDLSKNMDKLPNYKKAMDKAPLSIANLYSSDKKLYGFYFASYGNLDFNGGREIRNSSGVRQDIFEKNQIAIPNTVDDMYNAAKKLKTIYPNKYPITIPSGGDPVVGMLYASNHVGGGRYYNGTKFVYGPLQDGYKDAVVEMNRWYKEGLVSPDFLSQTGASLDTTLAAGDAMILPDMWYGYPAEWEQKYKDQKWVMLPTVANSKYGNPWSFQKVTDDNVGIINNWGVLVNANSKVKDDMIKLMDVQYTDDIANLESWGILNETYNVSADGKKQFTDKTLQDPGKAFSDYGFGTGSCRPGIFPQVQELDAKLGLIHEENIYFKGKETREKDPTFIKNNFSDDYCHPESTIKVSPLTADESQSYANVMTPIDTYVKEQAAKFIMGKRPISEWDNFIKELNKMGDIQKAMDIYNSKIKK